MAKALKDATLLIMDEITMLPKHGLRCIDKLLRDIMKTNVPFGGKVLVISGDFRQTLPVVPRGSRTDIMDTVLAFNQVLCGSISKNLRLHLICAVKDKMNTTVDY